MSPLCLLKRNGVALQPKSSGPARGPGWGRRRAQRDARYTTYQSKRTWLVFGAQSCGKGVRHATLPSAKATKGNRLYTIRHQSFVSEPQPHCVALRAAHARTPLHTTRRQRCASQEACAFPRETALFQCAQQRLHRHLARRVQPLYSIAPYLHRSHLLSAPPPPLPHLTTCPPTFFCTFRTATVQSHLHIFVPPVCTKRTLHLSLPLCCRPCLTTQIHTPCPIPSDTSSTASPSLTLRPPLPYSPLQLPSHLSHTS